MAFLETPDRVLKRLQQLEDKELPSLPSFQHDDIDFDSMSGVESLGEEQLQYHQPSLLVDDFHNDMATPHPLRKVMVPPPSSTVTGTTHSSADSFSTASGSPFPPIDSSPKEGTPSPYASTAARTSTPQSHQARSISHSIRTSTTDRTAITSRSSRHERTRSGTGSLGNSTHASRSARWQTPGEMSGSFSGDEIAEGMKLGAEKSIPLNDLSGQYEDSYSEPLPELPSLTAPPEETPVTRRLSSGNVLFERPRRRGPSATLQQLEAVLETPSDPSTPVTPNVGSSQTSVVTALPIPQNERIPSLSRSEISGTDVSEAASTPEGPVRNISMVTPRPDAHQEYEITGEYQYEIESADGDHGEHPTWEYNQGNEFTTQEDEDVSAGPSHYQSPHKMMDTYSPAKQAITPSIAHFSTPGTIRGQPFRHNSSETASAPSTILYDITDSVQNTPFGPFTPSPAGMTSKTSDISTPRAPLDDAERRKSHVLAVLGSSSGPPSRILRPHIRGTPHPLRRVSTAPHNESIAEEGSDIASSQRSLRRAITPGMTSRMTNEQSVDQSFVSVASSADLTSDKRASHLHNRLSRGNTSFPTILLPTSHPPPGGGSLKGLSDQRADGIKIHKHLNAMNKQLLETNADLAREAEAWRDEADRLRGILEEHGIDVEDVDILAGLNAASTSANLSQQLPDWPSKSPSSRNSTKGDHPELISQLSALSGRRGSSPHAQASTSAQDLLEGLTPEEYAAVMQEMAEKLESLEEGLNEKDQIIAELKDQLEHARQAGSPEQQELIDEIDKLSAQLEEAEQAGISLHAEFSAKTEQHAQRFGEICSGFEEQVKALEKDLGDARLEVDRLSSDKSRLEKMSSMEGNAQEEELRKRITELERELHQTTTNNSKQPTEVENLKRHSAKMLEEKEGLMHRVEDAETEIEELRARIAELEGQENGVGAEDLEAIKGELKAACEAQTVAEDELERLEQEMATARKTISEQETELDQQHEHIEELNKVVTSLEADLAVVHDTSRVNEEVEEELRQVQQELQKVNEALSNKESEIEMLKGRLEVANIATQAIRTSQRRSTSPASTATPTTKKPRIDNSSSDQDSLVAAMEERLDEAYREIGRLKHELNATPHRKSAVEVRDARIQALEREKAALADRLASGSRSMTMSATPVPAGVQDAGSPFKRPTPLLHKAIASLRTPKTPGPLAELSWLQTTIGDANEPILQAQLEYLQKELQDANNQLDHNFSRLEAAGLGGVALAEKLAAAEERIGELEDEIRTLVQRNKASLALVSAQKEERERDNEGRMRKALEAVHSQMEELKSDISNERSRLQRDNGRLQNLVSEMRLKSQAEVESFRAEMGRMAEKAEGDLKATRDDLSRVIRERDNLKRDLESSRTQIAQLERDIAKEQRAYESLSRRNAQVTQSAASQAELAQKAQMVESLQTSLRDAQRESEDLRNTLSQRTRTLEDTKSRLAKLQNERAHVMQDLEEFERDLQTQRAESKEFGKQLAALKMEQNNTSDKHQAELRALERELKEARDSERRTFRELDDVKRRYDDVENWRMSHECETGLSQALIDQKTHFKTQSRSLASQIRYLKAKFTRESTFRNALALQKRYLLLLVGGMSLDQQSTLRAMAQMGYPVAESESPRPRRTFKAVALAVCSIIRARNTADQWKKERELKMTIGSSGLGSGERRRVSART